MRSECHASIIRLRAYYRPILISGDTRHSSKGFHSVVAMFSYENSYYPKNYMMIQKRFPEVMTTHEKTGKLATEKGSLGAKTGNLIQLAACEALRSEGRVLSHARRALQAGALKDGLLTLPNVCEGKAGDFFCRRWTPLCVRE